MSMNRRTMSLSLKKKQKIKVDLIKQKPKLFKNEDDHDYKFMNEGLMVP